MRLVFIQDFKFVIFLIITKYMQKTGSTKILKRSPLEIGLVTFPVNPKIIHTNLHDEEKSDEHHINFWVPGKIRHHAFIPPHSVHIFVPLVITKHQLIVKEKLHIFEKLENDESPLIGGYGVGSYFGGQGSGHGFQINFNECFIVLFVSLFCYL